MRLSLCFAMVVLAVGVGAAAETPAPRSGAVDLEAIDEAWSTQWRDYLHSGKPIPFTPPAEAEIPKGPYGDLVRDGLAAFKAPAVHAPQYVGNRLSCSNCHLDGGRRAGAMPMWGAYPVYPKFRNKNDRVNTIEMRIQGCFRFSMNGRPPPADSQLMKSYVAYFAWLSQGAPIGGRLVGAGLAELAPPAAPPDLFRGEKVYAQYCTGCHGADGAGVPKSGAPGWTFPPLWGSASYNWGAGMHDTATAAAFIKWNMPYGEHGVLDDQQAWDVAFFMNSHERPQDPRFDGNLAETRRRYHDDPYDLYGTEVNGTVLGATTPPH